MSYIRMRSHCLWNLPSLNFLENVTWVLWSKRDVSSGNSGWEKNVESNCSVHKISNKAPLSGCVCLTWTLPCTHVTSQGSAKAPVLHSRMTWSSRTVNFTILHHYFCLSFDFKKSLIFKKQFLLFLDSLFCSDSISLKSLSCTFSLPFFLIFLSVSLSFFSLPLLSFYPPLFLPFLCRSLIILFWSLTDEWKRKRQNCILKLYEKIIL